MFGGVGIHGLFDTFACSAEGAAVHKGGADGEAVEPGFRIGGGAECFPIPHGGDGDILHDIISAFKTAEASDGDGPEPGAVNAQGFVGVGGERELLSGRIDG